MKVDDDDEIDVGKKVFIHAHPGTSVGLAYD
jgi:hypothetical protein